MTFLQPKRVLYHLSSGLFLSVEALAKEELPTSLNGRPQLPGFETGTAANSAGKLSAA